jgi:cytochrome oxidase Cu insertion factor (SCO1/SenC/PrrC family)
MSTEEKNKKANQKWIVVVLFILFALPFSLSWFLFNFTDFGRGEGTASHGTLIDPPRLLSDATLADPAGALNEPARLYGKWSLVYLVDGECDEQCEKNLYRMRQIRLAMGKHAHRVQRVLINFNNDPLRLTERQLQEYRGQLVAKSSGIKELVTAAPFKLSEDDAPLSAGRLYIVDPRGFLMMSYAPEADPGGIIKDLQRLLRYSSVG